MNHPAEMYIVHSVLYSWLVHLADIRTMTDFWSNAKYYLQYRDYPLEFRLEHFTHLTPEDYKRWKLGKDKTMSSSFDDKLVALANLG